MTNENIEPNDKPEDKNSDEYPIDDSGINNDHILDLCDFAITTLWHKYVGSNRLDDVNTKEIKDLVYTLQIVWSLCQDIIDLDRRLRDFGEEPPDNFNDEGFPNRLDDMY